MSLDRRVLNQAVTRGVAPFRQALDQVRLQHPNFLSWGEHVSISVRLIKVERIIVTSRYLQGRLSHTGM
jgi:hypothetical protein